MPDKLFDILAMTDFAEPAKEETPRKTHRRKTQCYELSTKYLYRRAFSETSLLDACEKFEFQEGHAYHFITGGDVDSLSYLKAILRQQPLSYCLFSTWCMAAEDILQFEEWLQAGRIGHLDGYVGEIFPNSYRVEYQLLKDVFARNCGGGENRRVQESFENICRHRAEIRLRSRNIRQHQHQPTNRKRLHHYRPRHLRVLPGVFRRDKIF
ncbi:hypothetical protein [Alistipes shahii]|uniref:hypothetical protein n=1 Tax=Alistipes shahii TaxID=328814 RepID=UPI0011CA14A1|nr:hypothetical protein [Alistipes shahii]